jgi:predicted nucleic acid-binding protein
VALVVDASVALKWVLDEPETGRALALIGAEPLLAPEFLDLECANVLARDVRRGLISAPNATEALASIAAVPMRRAALPAHVAAAHAIAVELQQSVYDSLYLALALAERAVLVTADGRFARAALARPAYAASVRLL